MLFRQRHRPRRLDVGKSSGRVDRLLFCSQGEPHTHVFGERTPMRHEHQGCSVLGSQRRPPHSLAHVVFALLPRVACAPRPSRCPTLASSPASCFRPCTSAPCQTGARQRASASAQSALGGGEAHPPICQGMGRSSIPGWKHRRRGITAPPMAHIGWSPLARPPSRGGGSRDVCVARGACVCSF